MRLVMIEMDLERESPIRVTSREVVKETDKNIHFERKDAAPGVIRKSRLYKPELCRATSGLYLFLTDQKKGAARDTKEYRLGVRLLLSAAMGRLQRCAANAENAWEQVLGEVRE